MGGNGSGKHPNYCSRKDTVDDYLVLSLNSFRSRGRWRFLNGKVTWSRGDRVTASIGYKVYGKWIDLEWRNGDGEVVKQRVPFAMIKQRIWERYIFMCPRCERHVVKLYAGSIFLCRHCHDLTYESCQESHSSFHRLLGFSSDKQYRNFFKSVEYSRELGKKKRVGKRMLARLDRYIEKSGVIF